MYKKRILEKDEIRIIIEEYEKYTSETIEIKYNDNWISLLRSNKKYSTLNYWTNNERQTKRLEFLKSKKKKIYYKVDDEDFNLNLDYCIEESNILHIRYKLFNKKVINLSKLIVNYSVVLGDNPDYIWVPHLRPEKDFVMGDHIFRSPVIIYKKGEIAIAFIPDLKTLQNNRPFQSFIDFNLKSEASKFPQISYGFGNYEPTKHIFFKHLPSKIWRIGKDTNLTFRYYIIVFSNKDRSEILKFINEFFWKKYIRRNFYENLNPQVVPYEYNVKEGFKAIFERHKFWGNFTINKEPCGGIWERSWAGAKKRSVEFIEPHNLEEYIKRNTTETASSNRGIHKMLNEIIFDPDKVKWFDKYTRRHAFVPRTAEIWNNAWFLNIRTAYALRYFGEIWNNYDYLEKSKRILNTLINLPRFKGIFPNVIFPSGPNSSDFSYINGLKGFLYSEEFNIVDACLAMYWALKYYQDFEKDNRVIEKGKELLELIDDLQENNGAIPIFIKFRNGNIVINDNLLNSASSGAVLMFLTDLYKVIPNKKTLLIAERIADFIQKEIIPEDKWHDFEPFYSCTQLPFDFFDKYTKNHVKNTLCIYWCAEGFKELYKITKKVDYLENGEYILAILSLFQQVWNIPYISYDTFGGFGVQNADAELSDARQALFVRTYLDYYLVTEKEEYMERGLAALRASWALQFLREYEEISPGNIKGIDTVDNIDKGCIYENYGHTGSDYRVPGQITFDWGVGTAAAATAYAKKHFGDLFIDFRKEFVWGIDGILIKSFEFKQESLLISLIRLREKRNIILKARNVPENGVQIIINEESIGLLEKNILETGYNLKI